MKRFYKFLLPLVAIVAMALPVNVVAQDDCANGTIIVANADNSTATTSYFPGYSLYNYSVSEELVPASALEGLGGEIFSMQFKPAATTAGTYFTNCEVYLANSTLSDLSAGWVQDGSLQLVYSGSLNYTTTDWQTITFDTSFAYTGGSLIVLVRRNHGSWTSGSSFEAYDAGVIMGRYLYQDSGPYTIGSLSGGSTTSTVAVYKFTGCYEPIDCAAIRNLTASNITADGVTLTWVDLLNSDAMYEVINLDDNTVLSTDISDTTTDLTDLTGNTLYTLGVYALCGGGDTSSMRVISFRTACVEISSLPYINDFETEPYYSSVAYADAFPSCWTRINDATGTYNYYPYLSSTASYVHSGSVGMYWYHSTTTSYANNEYAILPPIDTTVYNIPDLTLSFYARTTGTSYHPQPIIGVMTDASDASTFTPLDTVGATEITTDWQLFVFSFANYEGYGNLIAIKWPRTSSTSYMAIDDIFLTNEWCDVPVNVTASDITSTSITVSWGANGGSNFSVYLGEDTVVVNDDTSYTFNNLTPNTPYVFGVATVCSSGLSTYIRSSARTACAPIDTLPYVQNFNDCPTGSSNVFDPCWSIYNTYSATSNYPYVSSGYLYMYLYNSSNVNSLYGYAMLPELDDALATTDMELSFDVWGSATASYGRGVIVAVFDDVVAGMPTFDTLAVIIPTATSQAAAETYYVTIADRDLTGKRIGFFYQNLQSTTPSYYYTYIDNVSLHEAPSCFVPSNFAVNAAQADSVILSWTDTVATTWQVAVGVQGFNPDTVENPIIAYETELVLDELAAGFTYQAYVRADCGDEQSMWIGPVTFTPGAINMGVSGSATLSVCGATIFDDGGATGQYSSNCDYTLTLYPNDSTKRFKFWGSGSTESCCDYLRIYAGVTASGAPLAQMQGENLTIDTVTTQGGPITLFFHSDGSVVKDGFEIHVTCVDMAACRDIDEVTVHEVSTSSAYVSWRNAVGTTPLPENYIVTVTDTTGIVVNTVTTSDMFAVVGGMSPNTDYIVSVIPACDEANGEPAVATLTTGGFGCLQVDATLAFSDTIGNGTSTSTYLPSYSYYNYGLSQQIYTAAEIGHSGLIDNISFMWNTVSQQRTYEIYMGHVTEATASNFLHPADLTLVYNGGPVTMTANQWTTFNLTTPFSYNGADNLLVVMRDMTGSYVSGNAGYVHSAASGAARYAYQDGSAYDPYTFTGGTSASERNNIVFGGAPCAVQATCAAPLLMVTGKTDNSVSIVWAPGDVETDWNVEHKAFTDATWTVDLTNTTTTSLTVTGLQPNTKYEFRVYHLCGTDTFATVRTVTTDCPGTTVPFSENFATWATGTTAPMPSSCWFKGSDYNANYPYVTTGNSMAGDNNSMYFYASGTTFTYMTLPKLNAPLDTLVVSGYIKYSSNGYALQVGLMSDPEDASTFQAVGGATTVANQWVPFEVSFVGQPDGYIAFGVGNGGSYTYLYLDNIEVNYYNPCERPTNVHDSANTLNSAVVYWTDTVTTDFEVEYGPVGFQHGQGTTVTVSDVNYLQITGLTHSSQYDVYVRGLCDNNFSNWSFVHTFATQCGTIDVLPFTENFDNWGTGTTSHAPMCWAYGSDYSTTYPYISSVTDHGGAMYLYNGSTAGSTNKTWFAMPALDNNVAQINQTQVVFSAYKATTAYQCPVMVGIGNDTSVVWMDTIIPTYDEWNEYEVVFDNYTGTGRHVFFATHIGGSDAYSYPYIDDITLEMIPTCPRPDSLTVVGSTTNSVDLAWHDRAGASMWQIEYGPRGFQLGTGTTVIANSNPFTLTGLPAAYQGEYYVKAICSSTDTGEYSRRPAAFETTQIPATLPYNYDFENVTEWNNWQTSSNSETNNWFRGSAVADSGSYSMYVSADAGATYKPYLHNATVNAAAYRDIDFGPIDSSYTLSFRARAGGTIANYYDGLMVFLVDPSLPTVASTNTITSPWGSVNDLYRIATVRLDTTWQTYEASFDTIHGVHRVAFFWFNQNTSGTNLGEPAAVDNIHIKYATCPRPVNLDATPTTNSAMLTWQGPANANYEITYRMVGDTVNQTVVANTNSYNLTGLISPASYLFWVRKLCGAGDTSLYSDGLRFSTLCSPITAFPWYEDFNSYTATGYSTAGSMPNGCWDAYSDGTSEAYVPHVTNGSSYQYSPDNSNSIVMVATSSSGSSYGKNVLIGLPQFGAPISSLTFSFWYRFESTSYGMLEVGYMTGTEYPDDFVPVDTLPAISDDGSYDTITFEGAPASATRIAIRWTNPQTSTWYSLSLDNFEVNANSYIPTCDAPAIVSATAEETTATVTYLSTAAVNQVAIVQGNVTEEGFVNVTAIDVADTFYTFNGLTASTEYTIGVRAVCSDDNISDWVLTHVTTEDHPCYNIDTVYVSNVTLDGATINWVPGESIQTVFEVRVYNNTYDTTCTVQGVNSLSVSGLYQATTYNVTVRAVCGENNYSDWTTAVQFTTTDCVAPTGITVTAEGRVVTVSWQSTGADRYRVIYFDENTSADEATVVEVGNGATTTTVTVPEGDMTYSFFVFSYCGDVMSTASDEATVDILGIGTVNVSEVTLYPNPASTTVTVGGIEGESTVTVVDMNGRTVYTATATSDLTIDLSGMAKGAYFVRIIGEQATAVRKLIVK